MQEPRQPYSLVLLDVKSKEVLLAPVASIDIGKHRGQYAPENLMLAGEEQLALFSSESGPIVRYKNKQPTDPVGPSEEEKKRDSEDDTESENDSGSEVGGDSEAQGKSGAKKSTLLPAWSAIANALLMYDLTFSIVRLPSAFCLINV